MIVSQHYKDFIIACLQTDYDTRASPDWAINFEWPLASDFVEGVEAEPKVPPLNKVQSTAPVASTTTTTNIIEEDKQERTHRRIQHQFSLPTPQQRDKSPSSKHELLFNNLQD